MADKCPREYSPEQDQLEFVIPKHQARFERMSKLRVGQSRFPNVGALREVQLADDMTDEVEELLAMGS